MKIEGGGEGRKGKGERGGGNGREKICPIGNVTIQ